PRPAPPARAHPPAALVVPGTLSPPHPRIAVPGAAAQRSPVWGRPTGVNRLASMLFSPEAHEALADESWSAERALAAIVSIVADAERAFDDGWPLHPQDQEDENEAGARFRTV